MRNALSAALVLLVGFFSAAYWMSRLLNLAAEWTVRRLMPERKAPPADPQPQPLRPVLIVESCPRTAIQTVAINGRHLLYWTTQMDSGDLNQSDPEPAAK